MKKQDILEKAANLTYLSIGSNLGDKKNNLEKAKYALIKNKIKIISTSSFYETPSWPNQKFPKFINIVILVKSKMSLQKLFLIVKKIEKRLGRKKAPKNYPRLCDIDIIDHNGDEITVKLGKQKITVSHPRMHHRNFVLFPLFEINSVWTHPKFKQKISKLLSKIKINNITSIKLI